MLFSNKQNSSADPLNVRGYASTCLHMLRQVGGRSGCCSSPCCWSPCCWRSTSSRGALLNDTSVPGKKHTFSQFLSECCYCQVYTAIIVSPLGGSSLFHATER